MYPAVSPPAFPGIAGAILPRNDMDFPSPGSSFFCLPGPGCPLFIFSSQYNNVSFHSPGALPPGSVLFPFRSPVLSRLFRRCPRLCSLVNALPSPAVPCALRRGRTCFPATPFRFSPHPSFRLEGQAPHGAQSRGRAGCVPEAAALRREEEMCRRGSVVRQRQEETGAGGRRAERRQGKLWSRRKVRSRAVWKALNGNIFILRTIYGICPLPSHSPFGAAAVSFPPFPGRFIL